jgi:polyferredoxin
VLWLGIGIGLVVALFLRANLDASITPVRNPPYVILSNGDIRNSFDMRLRNKHGEDRWFTVSATAGGDVTLALEGTDELRVLVKASDTLVQRLYVTAKAGTVAAKAHHLPLRIWITDVEGPDIPKDERIYKDTIFNGAEED